MRYTVKKLEGCWHIWDTKLKESRGGFSQKEAAEETAARMNDPKDPTK